MLSPFRAAASLLRLQELNLMASLPSDDSVAAVEFGTAVGNVLASSGLKTLKIGHCEWNTESFRPVALGVKNRSSSLTKVNLRGTCSFDEGSTKLFQEMFGGSSCLRSLEMDWDVRFFAGIGAVLFDILGSANCG
jgi:hypothetical protein